MKKLGMILVLVGILFTLTSLFGDIIGLGRRGELGAAQLLGIQIGAGLICIGIGFVINKINTPIQIREVIHDSLIRIRLLPPAFWVCFAFFLSYLVFFFFPVFLNSKLDILYLDNFISNQGRIGFDIRSIVHRIEAWLVGGSSPYADGFVGYPPLTVFLFSPLALVGYPVYFRLITILTLVCYVISTLLVPLVLVKKKNMYLFLLIFFTGLFSYGFQFEVERGQFNVIAFTFCLLAIYLFHERHEFRYWAYLLFTLSIQMKVYPVLYIVMFIRDWRDWKNNIKRLIGLAILNVSLLFILGYQMFLDFLKVILAYQFDYESNRFENLSIKGFVHSLAGGDIGSTPDFVQTLLHQNASFFEALFLILLGSCFLSIIAKSYFVNGRGFNPYLLIVCTIGCLVIPSVSNDYKLSILVAPIGIALAGMPDEGGLEGRSDQNLLIFIASLAYWSVLYPFNVKPEIFIRSFPALMVLLIAFTLLNNISRSGQPVPPTG